MANSLGRNIVEGEVVVVKKSEFNQPDTIEFSDQLFVCESGFGMKSFTSGQAIFGHWFNGEGNDRIEGFMIDRDATETYQKAEVKG